MVLIMYVCFFISIFMNTLIGGYILYSVYNALIYNFTYINILCGIYENYNILLITLELIFCFISLPFILLRHVILH
jgi:hypothetical protein